MINFCLFSLSCRSQNILFENELEKELKNYINDSWRNQSKAEIHRYINNEIKFILEARKDFFSNIKFSKSKQINLVEFFNKEMPSSLYTAVLKINSKIYFFKKNSSFEASFKKIDFKNLEKDYPIMSCVLLEMDKPKPNKLHETVKKDKFHFTVYVTKIDYKGKISVFTPVNLCD